MQVMEPQCDSPENTVVIGPMDIPVGETAICTNDFPTFARYTGSTPAVGAHWGVATGAMALSRDQTGFLILGDADAAWGTVRVRREPWTTPLFKAEATACFNPATHGGSGEFDLLSWDETAGDWVAFATGKTVYDPEYRVCLLPEELGNYRMLRSRCTGFKGKG